MKLPSHLRLVERELNSACQPFFVPEDNGVSLVARVRSLHLHPEKSGGPMISVHEIDLEAGQGIVQEKRYFGRRSSSGAPAKRQLTLIEREQIAAHAATLGLPSILPGVVRSNIETEGLDLVPLAGKQLQIGAAVLLIGAPRAPCEKMDRIAPGLRMLMDHGKQGVLAQVLVSGKIRVGDEIRLHAQGVTPAGVESVQPRLREQ